MNRLSKYFSKLSLFITYIKLKKRRDTFVKTAFWFSPLEITLPPRVKSDTQLFYNYLILTTIVSWQHVDFAKVYTILNRIDYNLANLNCVLANSLKAKLALDLVLRIQKDFETLFLLLSIIELKLYRLAHKKSSFINIRKIHTDQWMYGEVFDSFDRRTYRFHNCLWYAYLEQYLSRDMYIIWADRYLDCCDYELPTSVCKLLCNWTRDARELYFVELDNDEWNAHFFRYIFANNLSNFSAVHSCGSFALFMWYFSFELTMTIDLNTLHRVKGTVFLKELQFYQICLKLLNIYKKDKSFLTYFFSKIFIFSCTYFKYFRVFILFFFTCWIFQYFVLESYYFKLFYYFFMVFMGFFLHCSIQIKNFFIDIALFFIEFNGTLLTKKEFFLTYLIVPFFSFSIKLTFKANLYFFAILYKYFWSLLCYTGIFFKKKLTKLIILFTLYYIINLCLGIFLTL